MTWATFIATTAVITLVVVDLITLLINPSHMFLSNALRATFLGEPQYAFLLAFALGGSFGYMEPNQLMYSPRHLDLSYHTSIFCTFIIIALVLWDLVVVNLGGVDSSISRWCQDTAYRSPVSCFGAGFLSGHFFFYGKP